MSENGVATEVTATVEPSGKSDLQAMFDALPPEVKAALVKQVQDIPLDQREANTKIALTMQSVIAPTAGRPAVSAEALPAVKVEVPKAEVAAPAPVEPPRGPEFPSNERPAGFSVVPEAVFLWTAPGSEGVPLWGHLIHVRKRQGENVGRLVFKLQKAAHAFTRSGKRVVVPVGGFVMVTLTDSLEPLTQLAEKDAEGNDRGCPSVWLRAVGEMPVDGGNKVFAYDLCWEHMPDAPGVPRFYARELVLGKKA